MNTENTNTQPETVDPFPLGDATYCPEDNKLRFYSYDRFSDEIKNQIKEAGFRWAPKQLLWVAPGWTPEREDLLIELCGEIGDEDYSPLERAADRAERFEGYRGRRAEEAGESADRFKDGPQAFGHENAAKAERAARRHDRHGQPRRRRRVAGTVSQGRRRIHLHDRARRNPEESGEVAALLRLHVVGVDVALLTDDELAVGDDVALGRGAGGPLVGGAEERHTVQHAGVGLAVLAGDLDRSRILAVAGHLDAVLLEIGGE